jgi:Tol biopolymer transport system component/tRNA A-37 threonylcarbamoyl transferase component Bud32
MTPERWQQITDVFHEALSHNASQRANYIAERCVDDALLRRDVESMLAAQQGAGSFGETPAFAGASTGVGEAAADGVVLTAGTRIGPYEVRSLVGVGGMGAVYRARDTKLGRDVALKMLLPTVAAHPDRLARFKREARLLASLNHPNVASVHGLEETDEIRALVMELVDGLTLADRLAAGPIPVDQALGIAAQIAEAVAAAHEQHVIHRDLKPANIKLKPDGTVKVLDFGLAKLVASAVDSEESKASVTETGVGTILGTAAYMPPEQALGKAVDKRADLWAFGCVLFEMLTGHQPFAGDTRSRVVAAVLDREPDWNVLPSTTPPPIRTLLRRCLEKDLRRRLDSASVARIEIDDTVAMSRRELGPATLGRPSSWRGRVTWLAVATIAGLAIAVAARAWVTDTASFEGQRMQLVLPPPERTSFGVTALSPDGRWLAFSGETGTRTQLWLHAMDGTSTRPLPGTEGAALPFWSPDSRAIGFFAGGKLRRVGVAGGVSATLADVAVPTGGTWSRNGVVLFGTLGTAGLSQVPASGGAVVSVIRPEPSQQETDYLNPFFLPDGTHFLYNILSGRADRRGLFIGTLDGAPGKRLLGENSNAAYAGLAGEGVLLFTRDGALLAQPFDPERQELRGEPVQVTDYVGTTFDASTVGVTRRHFTASNTGVLVFDSLHRRSSQLEWSDRSGRRTVIEGLTGAVMLRVSPDGRRFAVARRDERNPGNSDIWVANADGSNPTRLSFDPADDIFPVWSPDGARIRWASNRDGVYHLYEKAVSGMGHDRLLFSTPLFKFPTDWSRDGRFIFYRQIDPRTAYDIWFVSAEPDGAEFTPRPFLQTTANEAAAVLSPDGEWIAYASDESGRYEVYVQSFPDRGGKRQISTAGGLAPLWRSDGRELFFHALDGKLMAVHVENGSSMTTGPPAPLFSFLPGGALITPYYSVAAEGQRFLLSTMVESDADAPLSVLVNWHLPPQGSSPRD